MSNQLNYFINSGGNLYYDSSKRGASIRKDGSRISFNESDYKTWHHLAQELGHLNGKNWEAATKPACQFLSPKAYSDAILASEEKAVRNEYQAAKEIYPDVVGKSAQEAAGLCFARGREGR